MTVWEYQRIPTNNMETSNMDIMISLHNFLPLFSPASTSRHPRKALRSFYKFAQEPTSLSSSNR